MNARVFITFHSGCTVCLLISYSYSERNDTLAGGSALVLAARWDMPIASEKAQFGAGAMPGGWVDNPNVFIHIDADGTVTIVNNRFEMGQGLLRGPDLSLSGCARLFLPHTWLCRHGPPAPYACPRDAR